MITFQQESSGPPSYQMPWSVQVADDGKIIHGRPDADYLVGFVEKGGYNIVLTRPEAIDDPFAVIGYCPVYQKAGEMFTVDLPVAKADHYEATEEALETLRRGERQMRDASDRINGIEPEEPEPMTTMEAELLAVELALRVARPGESSHILDVLAKAEQVGTAGDIPGTSPTTVVLTVSNIVDQAHLDLIVDLINTEAYVSDIAVKGTDNA